MSKLVMCVAAVVGLNITPTVAKIISVGVVSCGVIALLSQFVSVNIATSVVS